MIARLTVAAALGTFLTAGLLAGTALAQPARTLQDALAQAYSNNPTLLAARAQLRATDENVPQALAGWRPQVTVSGTAGIGAGKIANISKSTDFLTGQSRVTNTGEGNDRGITSATIQLTQPIYRGGRTRASTNRAENQVMAQRAALIATEQQVFADTVNAFVTVIQDDQILQLDINNEQVLARQLQATNDRYRLGELTRTDVAQAEAALASATAARQTAEGNLQTARATYQRVVGELPGKLVQPQPLRLPVKSVEEASRLAAANNPNVVAALFNDAAAKDAFDVAYSGLMPNLSLQTQAFRTENQVQNGVIQHGGQVLASLTVPIYQGGSEYAAIRQARQQEQQAKRQVDEQRRQAVEAAISAWQTYTALKATVESDRAAIRANEIALEGVEREALVGSRTTLDVLNAQQALLNSQTTLVQALSSFVTASYQLAAAVGRLTARDLILKVPLYDERAYYNAVRDRWIGTGDYATDQPNR